jgi:hypothetical protein
LLAGLASLHQLLQGLGGAQPGIRLAGTDQHQMAAIRHLGQGRFETLGQLSWALAAKGTALQQHHAAASAKGRRAGLGCLAGVVAIEAAEVDGGPAGIHLRLHQRFYGTVAGSLVVAPEQVNGHGWSAGLRSAGCRAVGTGQSEPGPDGPEPTARRIIKAFGFFVAFLEQICSYWRLNWQAKLVTNSFDDFVNGIKLRGDGSVDDNSGSDIYGDDLYNDLSGTSLDDLLEGKGGRDILRGGQGSDTCQGGQGSDDLYGGQGNDYLQGGQGSDDLYGGKGDDYLQGGQGSDDLYGGKGDDICNGGRGADSMSGGEGRDFFVISRGRDLIRDFSTIQGDVIQINRPIFGPIEFVATPDGAGTVINHAFGSTAVIGITPAELQSSVILIG